MSKQLEHDLETLQRDILAQAGQVEDAIYKAIRALKDRDAAVARQVIEGDSLIDREENHLEEECLKILALHQPVASDLRRIAMALLINVDLERMGDLAENIAERALVLALPPFLGVPDSLQPMAHVTTSMVRQSLEAFVNLDVGQARKVCRLDDQVDGYNDLVNGELIRAIQANPEMVEPGLSLFSATRHLERIADHATNIAEDVIYLVEAEVVRHRMQV
jgi:phosphate transport system protein